jgi:hypothetical protein
MPSFGTLLTRLRMNHSALSRNLLPIRNSGLPLLDVSLASNLGSKGEHRDDGNRWPEDGPEQASQGVSHTSERVDRHHAESLRLRGSARRGTGPTVAVPPLFDWPIVQLPCTGPIDLRVHGLCGSSHFRFATRTGWINRRPASTGRS